MDQAQYSLLDSANHEIRLLTLQPGLWNDDIVCSLSTVSLDDNPEYEALSYTWGDPGDLRTITLHGHRVKITKNLYYALRRLRGYTTPRVMWVDAICINQADEFEKSAQVAMMSKVFSCCIHAVLWLGEDPDLAEAADHSTPSVSKTAQRAFELLSIMGADNHSDDKSCFSFEDDGSIAIHEDFAKHFMDLETCASLPWWNRVWALQESALPPSVIFTWASETCSFEEFEAALENFLTHFHDCCFQHWDNLERRVTNIYRIFQTRLSRVKGARHRVKVMKNNTLSQLYQDFIGMQASQTKDLFYGLLGMVTEWAPAGPLAVDYTLTDVASLARAFVYCIRQDNALDILLSQRSKKDMYPGPTWFPDIMYDFEQDIELIGRQLLKWRMQALSASSSRRCNEARIICDSVLVLAGTRVDRVARVSTSFDLDWVKDDWTLSREMKDKMAMAGITAWPADVPLENTMHNVFWRSIIHDCVRLLSPQTGDFTYRRAEASDYDDCVGFLEACLASRDDAYKIIPSQVWDALSPSLDTSMMFITDAGRLGIGHVDCKVGDDIWILNGSRVPHILRPSGKFIADPYASDAEPVIGTHEMVGEAYVHGLMYHEEHSDELKALVPETVYLI